MESPEEKKNKTLQRISNCAIIAFMVSLLLEGMNEVFKWSTLISCIVLYIDILLKEQNQKHRISVQSGILCIAAILWAIIHAFYSNIYANVLGQCIVYGFLLQTGKALTGKANKILAITVFISVLVNLCYISLGIKWLVWGVAILQVVVFLLFLDPILEKIALEHREKRIKTNYDLNKNV